MRLLSGEQKEISRLMDQLNLSDQSLLVKRKGWVHIEINDCTFAFYRKKSVRLIEDKFIEKIQYFIRLDKLAKKPVKGFSEVMEQLATWLKSSLKEK